MGVPRLLHFTTWKGVMETYEFKLSNSITGATSMRKIIPFILGFLLLGIVLFYTGIGNIVTIISETNLFYFFLAAVSCLIVEILAALKLKLVSHLNFPEIFLSHQGGMFLSQITPGRIGYLYTAYSLAKKENKSISAMVGLISLIQGLMIASKIFVLALALIYFSFLFEIPYYLFLSFLTPVLAVIIIIFFLYSNTSKELLSKIFVLRKGVRYLELMQKSVKNVSKKVALEMVTLDLIGWLFYGLQFFLLINALGVSLSFLTCLMLQPLITAVLLIPISPTGLGLAESESALIFSLLGLESGIGVAFLLLFRINSIFVDSIGIIDLKTMRIPKKLEILLSS